MSPWNRELVRASLAGLRFDEPKPLPRRAAVAIVLHLDPEEQGTEVLLMKRVERQGDPWSGQISLPGGRFEPEDPDLLATAIRETEEELLITPHDITERGTLSFQFVDGYKLHCTVFTAKGFTGEPTETDEAVPL